MNTQEDLATLFSRQMNMDSPRPHSDDDQASRAVPKIAYSISRHYHHSSHVTSKPPEDPVQEDATSLGFETSPSINDLLVRHGVDPESLSPSQRKLFEQAIPEQQLRLLQIWQICSNRDEISYKADTVEIKSCLNPSGDIEMCEAAHHGRGDDDVQQHAEDYMVSGYGLFSLGGGNHSVGTVAPLVAEHANGSLYNPSKDPVYLYQVQRWWEHTARDSLDGQYETWEGRNGHAGYGLVEPGTLG